jgi:ABC-type sulfate/molybdate transport systems ATPase subunit
VGGGRRAGRCPGRGAGGAPAPVDATHQITTLHVTHDRRGAAALAHRIVVLDHGRIRADGTTGDVLNDPAVATHIGGDSLLDDALAAHLHDRPESTLDTD